MESVKTKQKVKCDINGCKNLATHTFLENQKQFVSLCDDCCKKLYEALSALIVPKAIEAPFKPNRRKN